MRTASICLLSLGFSAALGLASAQAQALDGPIVTAPAEVFATAPRSANVVAPALPRQRVAPLDLSPPRETVTAATLAAVEAPEAQALADAGTAEVAAEVESETAQAAERNAVQLTGDPSLSSSALAVGSGGGGLLRNNPALQRTERRPVGLMKFKF